MIIFKQYVRMYCFFTIVTDTLPNRVFGKGDYISVKKGKTFLPAIVSLFLLLTVRLLIFLISLFIVNLLFVQIWYRFIITEHLLNRYLDVLHIK